MKLGRFSAFVGSILTLVQALLLAYDQKGICFNDGCEVVDSLTIVDPLFINLGGFIFFQTVFWGIWFARNKPERMRYVKTVLLAGLAAEAVLVAFQYLIAQTFCSYCLLIFGLVVILNLLAGLRHFIVGAVIFSAVLAGFASLQFSMAGSAPMKNLQAGIYASVKGSELEKRYLFFSSSCKYCEEVIALLNKENLCAINFNPIDEIEDFNLQDAELQEGYQPAVNKAFLQSMGLDYIPVLFLESKSGFQVISGAGPIKDYFNEKCMPAIAEDSGKAAEIPGQVTGSSQAPGTELIPSVDEACAVASDCDEPVALPGE